jgi:hypothetical protein
MAVNFISLSQRIKDKDPQGFLISYLQIVVAGKPLTLPTSDAYDTTKSAWESILYGVPGGYSSSFLIQLSNIWLKIIKAIPESSHPEFARRVLTYLETHNLSELAIPASEKPKPKGKTHHKGRPVIDHLDDHQLEQKIQTPTAHPTVNPVLASPQGSAYDSVHTGTLDFSKESDTDIQLNQALHAEDVDAFLISVLTKSLYQIKPNIPMSSVMDIIYYQWRDILMAEFNQVPSERFLKLLSKRWFNLMTQNGLPNSRDKIKALIYIVQKGGGISHQMAGKSMQKKRSWWQLFMKALTGCFIVSLGLTSGCREKISTYTIPKEPLVTDVSVMASFKAPIGQQPLPFKWTAPKNWVAQAAQSSFDRARFSVAVGTDTVTIAITSIAGGPPDLLNNLNRWRGQLKMSPATQADLNSSLQSIQLGDFPIYWVSLSNGTDGFEIAILKHHDENWFFKVSGSHAAVRQVAPQLRTLISTMTHQHSEANE